MIAPPLVHLRLHLHGGELIRQAFWLLVSYQSARRIGPKLNEYIGHTPILSAP